MNRFIKFLVVFFCSVISVSAFAQNISNKGREFWVGYGFHQFMDPASGGGNAQNMTLYISVEDLPAGLTYATVTITIDSSGLTPALWWKRVYHIPAHTVLSLDDNTKPAFSFSPAAALSWGPLPKGTQSASTTVGPYDPSGIGHAGLSFDCRLYSDPCPAGTGGFGLFRKKGVHITSDVDIVAYAHTYGSVSSGATMLLPTNSWGYSYTTINSAQGDAAAAYNFFYVLAKDDSTTVRITGSQAPRSNGSCTFTPPTAGTSFVVTLNKGQIFQYIGQADAQGYGVELTCSKVVSIPNANGQCKKIAVFAGSGRTNGESGAGCTASSRDNDMQQCFPEHTWGKTYATVPFSKGSGGTLYPSQFQGTVYKVVAKDTGTIININGGANINVNVGTAYKFGNSIPNYITSNKPIMVGQFMTSGNCSSGDGDPEMIYLSPLDQAIPQVGFYRNDQQSINENYVSIVLPDSGVSKLKIDGVFQPWGGNSYVTSHPNLPGYKIVVKGWVAAPAQTIMSCNTRFNAFTYGLGGAESYGYSSGAYFNDISATPTVWNGNDTTKNIDSSSANGHNYAYYSNQISSPVLLRFVTDKRPQIITWNFSKTYDTTKVTVVNKRTSAINKDVFDFHPQLRCIDSTLIVGSSPPKYKDFKYQCPDTMLLYLHNFNPNAAPFKIDTFLVPITLHEIDSVKLYTTTVGICSGSFGFLGDTVLLPYSVTYGGNLTITTSIPPCLTVAASFSAPDSVKYGVVKEKIVRWYWEFENGDTSTKQNPSHTLTLPLNLVYLTVTTASGLKVQTSVLASASTTIKYSAPDRVCVNQPITCIDSTIWINKDSCTWNFGDGSTRIIDKSCNPVTHTYTSPGTYTIWHKLTLGGSPCVLDSVPHIIVVSSKRYPQIDYQNPCGDTTGTSNFNANLGFGGVPITSYLWHFGDNTSGPLDSSKINPTAHTYTQEGDYTLQLFVVDSLGCKGDTTQTIPIKIKPHIYFNTLNNLCENAGIISFASKAGCYNKAKVSGTGVFKGTGVDAAGNFNPAVAGYGTHTIWYVYTTGKGCQDSLFQNFTVYDTAVVNFDYTHGCLPITGVAQFSNLTSISPGYNLSSFLWTFDDVNATVSNPNVVDSINPSHIFQNTGTYHVKLFSQTADGCKDSLTKTITFSVMPSVQFAALTGVCENATNVNVALGSVANNVTGTGAYFGNGTTSAGILSPAVSGYGSQHITYVFTTTGGCIDSASQNILVKARPRLGFTYPAGCLPANGLVQFTDTSKMPDTQTIQGCTWTFGGGSLPNTSNNCSPSHTYNYGTYTIYHSVTSSLGCVTDTTFNATFNISPQLFYNAVAPVCENITSYSVANAGSNNLSAAPGTGVYHGIGIVNAATGDFNPSIAGAGTTTIWYVFTATSGCIDSISKTITVKPKPRGQFTFTPTGCLNANGTVQFDASGIILAAPATITSYNWLFENGAIADTGLTPTHNYTDGTYLISLNVQASSGCSFDTSMTQTFNRTPALSALVQAPVCENGGVITLTAPTVTNGVVGTGVFSSYKNAVTNATTGTYDPSISGYGTDTIYYKFTSTSGGCYTTVATPVTINARPRGGFTFSPNSGCLNTNGFVQFSSNVAVAGSSVQTYNWQFETPSPLVNGAAPSHNYNDGTYAISLNVVGANTCSFDTSMTQTFSKTPALTALFQAPVCENGGVITLTAPTVTNGAVGTGVFSSSKNAVTNATTGTYDPSISGYGIDTIFYKFTSTGGCTATVKTLVSVQARPHGHFAFSPTTGCLDITGLVKFNGGGITVPGSFVQTYNWLFENGAITGTGANPTHNYADGTYSIKLTAIGFNGCSFDTSMTQTFSRTPSLDPIVTNNVCANSSSFTLNPPAVNNGVTGNVGVFTSTKNAVVGTTYDPTVAGFSLDTLYYTFTAFSGCAATVSKVMTIYPVPNAVINVNPNVCAGSTITLKDFSTVGSGTIAIRSWDVGDGSPLVVNPAGNIIVKSYGAAQTYTVVLTDTSDKGCVASDTATVTVRDKPTALFEFNPIVCMPNGTAYFTNKSTLSAYGGTMNYAWTFGDAIGSSASNPNTSTLANPKHTYSSIQSYPIRLIVTSSPYGCTDTYDDTLDAKKPFFIKPIAKFGVSQSAFCANDTLSFTDSSSAPGSNLFSWTWDYGDYSTVNTTTVPNTTYTYGTNGGQFQTALTVRNTELCESAPYYVNITVFPQPKIDSISLKDILVLKNTVVHFDPIVSDTTNVQYTWSLVSPTTSAFALTNAYVRDPYLTAIESQLYKLVVISDHNCADERTQFVKVLGDIVVPNVFSPNGDGINDTWNITSLGDYPNATVDIFNRSGNLVKTLSGSNMKWDGTSNGSPVPIGTYYYIINAGFKLPKMTGWVLVVR